MKPCFSETNGFHSHAYLIDYYKEFQFIVPQSMDVEEGEESGDVEGRVGLRLKQPI